MSFKDLNASSKTSQPQKVGEIKLSVSDNDTHILSYILCWFMYLCKRLDNSLLMLCYFYLYKTVIDYSFIQFTEIKSHLQESRSVNNWVSKRNDQEKHRSKTNKNKFWAVLHVCFGFTTRFPSVHFIFQFWCAKNLPRSKSWKVS